MEENFDKELDKLLRAHARTASSRANANEAAGAHLDADALAALVENSLPRAARSRYVAHLAECDSCRRLVANFLTLAPDASEAATLAANESEAANAAAFALTNANSASENSSTLKSDALKDSSAAPSLRERLAAIFAAPFMRFAAPAFASILVLIVGFVAFNSMRRNQEANKTTNGELVAARSEGEAQRPSAVATDDATGSANLSTNAPSGSSSSNSAASPPNAQARREPNSKTEGAATATTTAPASPSQNETQSKAISDLPLNGRAAQNAPVPSAESSDAVTKKPQPRDEEAEASDRRKEERTERNADLARARNESVEVASESPSVNGNRETARQSAKDTQNNLDTLAGAAPPPAPKASANRSASVLSKKAQVAEKAKTKADSDDNTKYRARGAGATRTVAGREFRQQDGVWVDTAYNGQSLTNVARGSEQFRALVADEPQIKRIADELGGAVIVVWKGRAYKIR